MLAEIIGSKASDFSVIEEMLALTLVTCLLCKRGWWYCLHCIPFSVSVHRFLRLQVIILWSLPAFFRQLKQAWFSCARLMCSSGFKAKKFLTFVGPVGLGFADPTSVAAALGFASTPCHHIDMVDCMMTASGSKWGCGSHSGLHFCGHPSHKAQ